jgi:MFS family permease
VKFAWRTRSLRWLALGAAVATLGGAALFHFGPSHVARVTTLSRAEIGAGMGLAAALGGLFAALLAGLTTDWLAKRDSRAYFATSALASLGTIPFVLAFLFAKAPGLGFVWLGIAVFFTSMYLGPVAALPQTLAPARMRATLVVVLGLVNTGIGQGLGAVFVGAVSDARLRRRGEPATRPRGRRGPRLRGQRSPIRPRCASRPAGLADAGQLPRPDFSGRRYPCPIVKT